MGGGRKVKNKPMCPAFQIFQIEAFLWGGGEGGVGGGLTSERRRGWMSSLFMWKHKPTEHVFLSPHEPSGP